MERNPRARQRAASLIHLPVLLAEFGVTLDSVLDGTGITAADLRPDRFIPFEAYVDVLERAALLTGCEDFGLRLGERQGLEALGPLGKAMRHAATLGMALSDFAAFQIHNSTGGAAYLHHAREDFILGYGTYAGPVSAQMHDMVLGVGRRLLLDLTAGAVRPTELLSMRPRPADPRPWGRLGDAPVRFGQTETCLVLPRATLNFPLPTADRAAREAALAGLNAAAWDMGAQVAHRLRALILLGRSTMPDVARELGTTPRTLRRALLRRGTSFERIKTDVRRAAALDLLSLTPAPIGDIATTLDFTTPAAFIRAFRRWEGTTPEAWRRDRLAP